MQSSKRIELILNYVKTHKHASIQALIDLTGSSAATIRRDVNKLAEQKLVDREHGGISYGRTLYRQPKTIEKQNININEKMKIAQCAVQYIKPDMTIFLDAGTTNFELAKLLDQFDHLTVITTDLRIAYYLSEKEQHTIITLGGVIDNYSQSVVNHPYDNLLAQLIPDISFCTCNAFDVKYGVTSPSLDKALLKKKLSKLGKRNILLADSSKFSKTSANLIAPLTHYDLLISDDAIPHKQQHKLAQQLEIVLGRVYLS